MSEENKAIVFTEEELAKNINVPGAVEEKLRDIVEKCLERAGIYHQVISRIKTMQSLALKYTRKAYGGDKKIQDLIGIRVDVYFEDDLKIVRNILERLFGEAEWSITAHDNEEFRPQKINGVFKLPTDLKNMISDETWNYYIDDTFEIQLKTVFFEGWHEIEHDMKYKGADLWAGKGDQARYFNTILATLELCDKSIVTLFENLAHDLYKSRNWAGMIKSHFRLKMNDGDLYPEVLKLFDEDDRVDNIPKRIFKTDREELVSALLELPGKTELTLNTIVAVINLKKIKDPRIDKIMSDHDVFSKRARSYADDEARYDLRLPDFFATFHADVILKSTEENRGEVYDSAVNTIYSWIYNKFSGVLLNINKEPGSTHIDELGFRIDIDIKPEDRLFVCMTRHLDDKAAGRIWVTSAIIMPQEDGQLRFTVDNGFTHYPDKNDKTEVLGMFSCPRFYRQIASQIGVIDVWECGSTHTVVNEEQTRKMLTLMNDSRRTFPIVMAVSRNVTDGKFDESWLGSFALRYMQEKAGHYTHFARIHLPVGHMLYDMAKNSGFRYVLNYKARPEQGVLVVMPMEKGVINCEWFEEAYIRSCSFTSFDSIQHLQPFKSQDSGKAFGNELLQLLRNYNTDYDPYKIK